MIFHSCDSLELPTVRLKIPTLRNTATQSQRYYRLSNQIMLPSLAPAEKCYALLLLFVRLSVCKNIDASLSMRKSSIVL